LRAVSSTTTSNQIKKAKVASSLIPLTNSSHKKTTQGSSLEILFSNLKTYSQPEAYGDAIGETQGDIETEIARCARYGYEYNHEVGKRRRVFMGSLIADDSWHVIAAHAAEAYGLYHTVAFIESNTTQTQTVREIRFNKESLNYRMLQSGIFGPKTDVYVDVGVGVMEFPTVDAHITQRWKEAGMQPDDIGIICGVDEVYTRDFLLALQSCDVPQFHPGQDCNRPEITGQGWRFEVIPDCSFPHSGYSYFDRPQAVIGECIDKVGDIDVHEVGLRKSKRYSVEDRTRAMYPLWKPWDFGTSNDNNKYLERALEDNKLHTAYHFHNFLDTFESLKNKYNRYGQNVENSDEVFMKIGNVVQCLSGEPGNHSSYEEIQGRRPILFEDELYRRTRRKEILDEMEQDKRDGWK